jgi:TrmH family RNA methyltransferase
MRRIRDLRRDRARRDADGVFVGEGIHLAEEALTTGAPIEAAVATPRLDRLPGGADLRRRLADAAPLSETSDAVMETLQDARSPQPVLVIVRRPPLALDRAVSGRGGVPLVVVAVALQDPGNLGGLVRTADGAGATGFVVAGDGVDLFHPRAVRATMGSIFRLPLARAPWRDVGPALAASGVAAIGTDPHDGDDYATIDWDRPSALVLGAESAGVPRALGSWIETWIRVPMHAGVESLSVGAAGAAILFEAARQRRARITT